MGDIQIGDIVLITSNDLQGTVRYYDTTDFQTGIWVGVELDIAGGKNDGSVAGKRYFNCKPGYGMFVKPANVQVIERPKPPPTVRASVNGAPKKPRPSSSMMTDPVKKRQSIAPSPSAGSRLSVRSPTKSPTKPVSSTPTTGRSTPRTSMAPNVRPASISSRPSSTSSTKPRTSTVGVRQSMPPPAHTATKGTPASRRISVVPGKTEWPGARTTETTPRSSEGQSSLDATDNSELTSNLSEDALLSPPMHSPPVQEEEPDDDDTVEIPQQPKPTSRPVGRPAARVESAVASKTSSPRPKPGASPGPATAIAKENEQLKAKLKMIEKKRMEDRDKLKNLEQLQQERDRFEGLIQKLQLKYQPQQQELTQIRKQLVEAQATIDLIERRDAEKDSEIEMATLDREMAEEMAESFKAEMEALRAKNQDLELEIQVLQEENDLFNEEIPAADKSSQGWMQMEREKTRLRDALIRLRELSQEREDDLSTQIKELTDDLKDFDNIRKDYELTKEQVLKYADTVADLQEQLDATEAQEDVIENLTDTNSRLQHNILELREQVQDLEDMQALNDELEADHQATERELQTELDFRESIIIDHRREFANQMRTIEELEFMVGKYKDTMAAVQKELEEMRESRQISETEAAAFDERSRAVMDLQLKLQTSESKSHAKKIDMQLQKLKAEESEQHLAILQNFVVDSYDNDRTPVEALLRFRRIGFKASTMESVLRDQTTTKITNDAADVLLKFEIEEKLQWVSGICTRFVTFGSHCTVEEFAAMGQAYYEVEPLERALNAWLDALRTNELDRTQCTTELNKYKAILVDLSEKLIPSTLATEADALHSQTLVVQSCLETVATVLPMLKDLVTSVAVVEEDADADADVEAGFFARKIQDLEFQSRSTKVVASKAANALEEMIQRSDSFNGASSEVFEQAESLASKLSSIVRKIISDVQVAAADETKQATLTYLEITNLINATARNAFSTQQQSETFAAITAALEELHSRLSELNSAATDISRTTEFERRSAPWTVRAKELKASRELTAETEETLRRLKSDLQAKAEVLAERDQKLEEQHIRIELLESRTKDAKQQATIVKELEAEIEKARANVEHAQQNYSTLAAEYEAMQRERDADRSQLEALRRAQVVDGDSPTRAVVDQSAALAMEQRLSSLRREIESLQSAVRYFKDENHRLQMPLVHADLAMNNHSWLATPLLGTARTRAAAAQSKAATVAKESQELLDQLLDAAEQFTPVNLKQTLGSKPTEPSTDESLPKPSKSIWRPIKSTPRYHVLKQREELEKWDELVVDLVKRQTGRKKKNHSYGYLEKPEQFVDAVDHIEIVDHSS